MTEEVSGAGKMTGPHKGPRVRFSYGAELDRRGRAQHRRRRVQARLDFAFVRAAVAPNAGDSGNGSVDPGVRWKLRFLLFEETVRSERELVRRLPRSAGWAVVPGLQPRCRVAESRRAREGAGPMARRGICGIVRPHRARVRRGRAGRWHHGAVRRLFGRGR